VPRFSLSGDVSSDNLTAVRPVLAQLFGEAAATETRSIR